MIAYLFIIRLIESLNPLLRFTAQKKILFKILLFIDNIPSCPRALMELYNEINVVFMSASNIHSYINPWIKE